jgi:putative ABC transport system substrate-binding protein
MLGATSDPFWRTLTMRVDFGQRVMERRTFLGVIAGGLLAAPLAAEAQQTAKLPRIGLLDYARFWDPLLEKLTELGYVEQRTIIFEYRASGGRPERLLALAQELVQRRVAVIVAYGTPVTQAAELATTTIPIVMVGIGDPVKAGLVKGLGHPEGNVTGNTVLGPDIGAKRLQLLREVLPNVSRVAFLWNPQNVSNTLQFENVQRAARALGVTLLSVQVSNSSELDDTFAAMMKERPHALMMTADAVQQFFISQILQFAADRRLPTVFQVRENVIAGGLMSYGPSLPELFRRAAIQVDKILRGAKPADLPVEQPTKFELVINLRTAQALGLTIPPSLLQRADQVIE